MVSQAGLSPAVGQSLTGRFATRAGPLFLSPLLTIFFFALLLAYGAFRYGAVLAIDWSLLAAGTGLMAAVYWVGRAPDRPPRDRLLFSLLAAVAAALILQLFPTGLGTRTPGPTAEAIVRVATCLLALLTARDLLWRYRHRPWFLAIPIIAVAFLESVLGLTQVFLGGPGTQARGTYVNRNHFAGLLELALPLAITAGVWLFRQHGKFETPASVAVKAAVPFCAATSILLGILFSLSRMGFLAAVASISLVCILSMSGGSPRMRWMPAFAVGVLILAALVVLPPPQLVARFADIASTENVSADTRSRIWSESAPLVRDAPLFGSGLGSYESVYMKYKIVAPMYRADFAHNDYLQILIECGLAGFLPSLAIALLALGGALHAATASPGEPERYLGIGCAGALFALMLHSLADFNLYIPANSLAASWLVGTCLGLRQLRPPRFSWRVVGTATAAGASRKHAVAL